MKKLDDILLKEFTATTPLHHNTVTVTECVQQENQAINVYRKVTLKKYNTTKYLVANPPKPISRILITDK
jgi:hypothetical protein